MNEKKETNIRALEQGIISSLELYRKAVSGSLPVSEQDKANLAQVIKSLCARVCEYVESN